jgi:hypothetical protein
MYFTIHVDLKQHHRQPDEKMFTKNNKLICQLFATVYGLATFRELDFFESHLRLEQ